ncbi:MAG: bifunctional precorrin-2 dehydrogenase/sirohydrochlorin ferrochelatase [Candidatus Omnitrophica bacterium]|nr:bifunctional precorrin-2 dehydrogenase/sirohydrochlorin ferrochelatase [Candidatus Omnitrophota bacterium]
MKKNTPHQYYPISVRLGGRPAVVVGGGQVAERKVRSLLDSGADVKVFSPQAATALGRMAKEKRIRWVKRKVRKNDIRNAGIVVAATDDTKINRDISRWAKEYRILANIVDQPLLCSFISPAVFRIDEAIIAVYTDGKDPVLSRDVKNFLRERWDEFVSYRNRPQDPPA